jgi:hypothetical protein
MVMMKAQYMKENNFHSKYVVNEWNSRNESTHFDKRQ